MMAGAVTTALSGAGDSLSSGLDSLSNMEGMENIEGVDNAMNNLNEAVDLANKLAANATTLGIVSIVAALVCLLGIIWMWQLKKKGFYVYVIGEIAAPIVTILLVGFGLGGIMATMAMIFPIIFIILWGLNLKHMS